MFLEFGREDALDPGLIILELGLEIFGVCSCSLTIEHGLTDTCSADLDVGLDSGFKLGPI